MKKKKFMSFFLALVLSASMVTTSIAADANSVDVAASEETIFVQDEADEAIPAETDEEESSADETVAAADEAEVSSQQQDVSVSNDMITSETIENASEESYEAIENDADASEETTEDIDASTWTSEDFIYTEMKQTMNGCDYTRTIVIEGQAVAGFSETGLKKIAVNKNLVIPSKTPDGETIIGVADNAFSKQGIQTLTLPEGMMVDYDDTVTHTITRRGNFIIGASAFYGNKLTDLVLPEGVIMIGSSSFMNNKLKSVSIPHTFWWLENSAFAKNELTTVGFPKTCDFQAQIHAMAFAYNEIKSVRLPDYMEVVEKKAFYFNPGMEDCPEKYNGQTSSEKERSFGGVVYMYTDNENLLNMERIHHIDRTVESQHSWHQKLIVGEDPSAVQTWTVEDFTFDGTTITGLSESGIAKRTEDHNLILPDKTPDGQRVTAIAGADADHVYGGVFTVEGAEFESVTLPAKLEKIGARAFANNKLTAIQFPETLKEIGFSAFQGNQLKIIDLPDSVETVGGGAFATNPTIEKVRISKNMTRIENGVFGCSDATNWMENFTEVTIPEGITYIGQNAFAGNNFSEIVIPANVTEIGRMAFSTKNYLKTPCTLTLPEGLEKIGTYAFRNKIIEEVILPTTVKKLDKNTFAKEYSDSTAALTTKVIVQTHEQYNDTKNFPKSDYHKLILRVEGEWNAEDFTYGTIEVPDGGLYPATDMSKKVPISGIGITGLSESGEAKLATDKNLVIPAKDVDGNQVIGIGAKAFYKKGLESVTFPAGVMSDETGDSIAAGVTQRGNFIILNDAFSGNNLTSLELPEGVIYIAKNAFLSNKLKSVSLPHTIWWIGQTAFSRNQIEELTFPQTCDYKLNIDSMAFAVNKIRAVRLPDRTEKLGNTVFLQNTGMEEVTSSTATTAQKKGGVVYMYTDNEDLLKESLIAHLDRNGDGKSPTDPKSNVQKLIVGEMPAELKPWGVEHFNFDETDATIITGFSEAGKKKLEYSKEVVLPEVNTSGEKVTAIADKAFAGTANEITAIESIDIPNTITSIGMMAFQYTELKSVNLPDSVTKLGTGAFAQNTNLTEVHLSANLTEIPLNAFIMCQVASVEIPEGVTTIGRAAFSGCNVTLLALPSTLETIDRQAFYNHQLESVVIPDSVETIGQSAFAVVQSGLKQTLKELTLGKNVKKIDNAAFRASALTEVEIPAGLETLHKDAFKENVNATDTGVASAKVKLYTSNTAHIGSTSGVISEGSGHTIIFNQIVGTGWTADDFTYDGAVVTGWSEQGNVTRKQNKNLVIPSINKEGEPITEIGEGAFMIPDDEWTQLKEGVDSPNGMQSVVLADTITTIGKEAFRYNCLETVEFPASVTTIGESAFNSNKLEKLVLPDTITTVEAGAFSSNVLTNLTLSKGMTKIEQGTFSMNIQMTHVDIPDTITEIGDMAFAGARLETLEIPASVEKIGRKAFHLHHLTELTIPGNVKEIGDSAFEGTFKALTLKKLTLEEGIESIGDLAFKEGYLESVDLPKSLTKLGKDPFMNNLGTDGDHVVLLYAHTDAHLQFAESPYHRIVPEEPEGQWKQNSTGYWYERSDGSYPANQWELIGNTYYYFNAAGYMMTGWLQLGNTWYYLGASNDGAMVTGWQTIGGATYYFAESGAMAANWKEINGTWYYFGSDGAVKTDWHFINGSWYYFENSGAMVTGWQTIGGAIYHFAESGAMASGWEEIDSTWYYFGSDGAVKTDWHFINGSWYYFENSGAMVIGWQTVGESKYYFAESGAMASNWKSIDDTWYYFGSDGAMKTGWQKINGKWYYMDTEGKMLANQSVDGYYLGADGAMQ